MSAAQLESWYLETYGKKYEWKKRRSEKMKEVIETIRLLKLRDYLCAAGMAAMFFIFYIGAWLIWE